MFKVYKNLSWTPDKIPLTHLLNMYEKILNILKKFKLKQPHPNLDKGEKRQLRNYQKRKISSVLMLIKEERLSL